MIDPCRESRCLKYPICIQKERIFCKLFHEYITYYVTEIMKFKHMERALYVSEKCRRDLWTHVIYIFPKLKVIIMTNYKRDASAYMYQIDRPEPDQNPHIENLYHNI